MRYGCGYPMGPLALLDLIGLDTAYEILDTMYQPGPRPAARAGADPQADGHRRACSAARPAAASTPTRRPTARSSSPTTRRPRPTTTRSCGTTSGASASSAPAPWPPASSRSSPRAATRCCTSAARPPRSTASGATIERSLDKADPARQARGVRPGRGARPAARHHLARRPARRRPRRGGDRRGPRRSRPRCSRTSTRSASPARSWPPPPRRCRSSRCAQATKRPQDVIGMHFFNPAPIMKLVEVVSTVATDEDVTETTRALCAEVGKVAVSLRRPGRLHRQRAAVPLPQRRGARCSRRTTPPPTTSTSR